MKQMHLTIVVAGIIKWQKERNQFPSSVRTQVVRFPVPPQDPLLSNCAVAVDQLDYYWCWSLDFPGLPISSLSALLCCCEHLPVSNCELVLFAPRLTILTLILISRSGFDFPGLYLIILLSTVQNLICCHEACTVFIIMLQ